MKKVMSFFFTLGSLTGLATMIVFMIVSTARSIVDVYTKNEPPNFISGSITGMAFAAVIIFSVRAAFYRKKLAKVNKVAEECRELDKEIMNNFVLAKEFFEMNKPTIGFQYMEEICKLQKAYHEKAREIQPF